MGRRTGKRRTSGKRVPTGKRKSVSRRKRPGKIPDKMRTKIFDRKTFKNSGKIYSSKNEAQKKATKHRNQGRLARVVPVARLGIRMPGYTVYATQRKYIKHVIIN